MAKKPPGSIVTLTWVRWDGPHARRGDYLMTRTGRVYRVYFVRGRKLICKVMRPDHIPAKGRRCFDWTWNARRRSFRPLL